MYGRDLVADLWGPEAMTTRRIKALLDGLPFESALWRAIYDTRPFTYRYSDDLIRLLLVSSETLRAGNWPRLVKDKFKPVQPAEVPWKREVEPTVPADIQLTPELFAQLAAAFGGS